MRDGRETSGKADRSRAGILRPGSFLPVLQSTNKRHKFETSQNLKLKSDNADVFVTAL